jgi:hypothetical protein
LQSKLNVLVGPPDSPAGTEVRVDDVGDIGEYIELRHVHNDLVEVKSIHIEDGLHVEISSGVRLPGELIVIQERNGGSLRKLLVKLPSNLCMRGSEFKAPVVVSLVVSNLLGSSEEAGRLAITDVRLRNNEASFLLNQSLSSVNSHCIGNDS